MGHVNRNEEVPIPHGAVVYGKSNKVYDVRNGTKKPLLIGYSSKDGMMYPNQNYYLYYRKEYLEFNPNGYYKVIEFSLDVGLYALILGVVQKTGIYDDLVHIFGVKDTNIIMDYVMFLISERENATYLMKGSLSKEVTFTSQVYSDSTYSNFFNDINKEKYCMAFCESWLLKCVSKYNLSEVYLTIDGSNDDCDAVNNDYAEPGKAKSKRSGPIIGFIWAVCGDGPMAGMPVAYFLNKGSLIDAKAVRNVVEYLHSYDIKVKGVICDRGFCDIESFLMFIDADLPYTIMLKKNVKGFKAIVELRGEDICNNPAYNIGDGLLGDVGFEQIFSGYDFKSNVSLIYDIARAGMAKADLLKKIDAAKFDIENNILHGHKASVPSGLKKYMKIEGEGSDRKVIIEQDKVIDSFNKLGFSVIATFEEMSADQAHKIYGYRHPIEKCFSYLKSQLGGDVLRVYSTESAKTKFFVCFLASIIRFHIQIACLSNNLETNKMIAEIGNFKYHFHNFAYRYSGTVSNDLEVLLNAFDITSEMLQEFSVEVTNRYCNGTSNPNVYQKLPWKSKLTSEVNATETEETHTTQPAQEEIGSHEKKKHAGGRPKGSKNKKTLQREAEEKAKREAPGYQEPVKGKAGRPLGSKDSYQRVRSTKKQMEAKRKGA